MAKMAKISFHPWNGDLNKERFLGNIIDYQLLLFSALRHPKNIC